MGALDLSEGATTIAVLLVKLPLYLNMNKLKVYLGFTPEAKKTGRYNHELRDWLARPATAICLKKKRTRNRKAIYKMELTILKTLSIEGFSEGDGLLTHERQKAAGPVGTISFSRCRCYDGSGNVATSLAAADPHGPLPFTSPILFLLT